MWREKCPYTFYWLVGYPGYESGKSRALENEVHERLRNGRDDNGRTPLDPRGGCASLAVANTGSVQLCLRSALLPRKNPCEGTATKAGLGEEVATSSERGIVTTMRAPRL